MSKEGTLFEGEIAKLTMNNFLGIQGTLDIDFADMKDGIWIMEGKYSSSLG